MKPEDTRLLTKLIGKTVVEVRVGSEDDYGFELVFDDGTTLEVYDLRCPVMSEECKSKRMRAVNLETGDMKDIDAPFIEGGVVWTVSKDTY